MEDAEKRPIGDIRMFEPSHLQDLSNRSAPIADYQPTIRQPWRQSVLLVFPQTALAVGTQFRNTSSLVVAPFSCVQAGYFAPFN